MTCHKCGAEMAMLQLVGLENDATDLTLPAKWSITTFCSIDPSHNVTGPLLDKILKYRAEWNKERRPSEEDAPRR